MVTERMIDWKGQIWVQLLLLLFVLTSKLHRKLWIYNDFFLHKFFCFLNPEENFQQNWVFSNKKKRKSSLASFNGIKWILMLASKKIILNIGNKKKNKIFSVFIFFFSAFSLKKAIKIQKLFHLSTIVDYKNRKKKSM